jgi:quercetin dioxygenase-like cupin family protein
MKILFLLVLLSAIAAAQTPAPIPAAEVPQRKEIFHNDHINAFLVELKPNESTPMHVHDRDFLTVFVSGGQIRHTEFGHGPSNQNIPQGAVRFRNAGFAHATQNESPQAFRSVIVEFAQPQGKTEKVGTKNSHYCNPGSETACVEEKYLFCTAKVCVEDVTMGAGAVSIKHSHTTDHMLVAVSDYQLTDQVEGKGKMVRTKWAGEVEYIPAGITHQLTNTGRGAARFIVVVWR